MVVLGIDTGQREVFVNRQERDGASAPQVLGSAGAHCQHGSCVP
jgi:hypothetical protein